MKIIVPVIIMLLSATQLYACSCEWIGPFLEAGAIGDVIIKGKVKRFGGSMKIYDNNDVKQFMIVEVQKVLKGNVRKKKIKIWGDDGSSCRPYIEEFELNRAYILSLESNREIESDKYGFGEYMAHDKEKKKDYAISFCYESYIAVHNDTVYGVLKDKYMFKLDETRKNYVLVSNAMSLKEFYDRFPLKERTPEELYYAGYRRFEELDEH